jgi:hypothetical protein
MLRRMMDSRGQKAPRELSNFDAVAGRLWHKLPSPSPPTWKAKKSWRGNLDLGGTNLDGTNKTRESGTTGRTAVTLKRVKTLLTAALQEPVSRMKKRGPRHSWGIRHVTVSCPMKSWVKDGGGLRI